MATFSYEAIDSKGNEVKDTVDADNSEEAIAKIRALGHFPTKVQQTSIPTPKQEIDRLIEARNAETKEEACQRLGRTHMWTGIALFLVFMAKPFMYFLICITCLVLCCHFAC